MTQGYPLKNEPSNKAARRRISRRKFLLVAGGLAGGACLTCVGLPLALTASGQPAPSKFEFVESTIGETTMPNNRILVAYASQAGSTAGVAEAISQQLATAGAAVDLRQVKDVTSLDGYRAVVVGSAIHGGSWMPEAVDFVKKNQGQLNQLPTAFFLVCMMAVKTDEQNRNFVAGYLEPVRRMVQPVAEGRFTGALIPRQYPFFEGLGLRIFLSYLKLKEGDYRDWDAIRAWADKLQPLLSN